MSDIFKSIEKEARKKGLTIFINRKLSRLARTKSEEEFLREFDKILERMIPLSGEAKGALVSLRKAFASHHPMTQIVPLLLQKRLSSTTRNKLAENFFVNWVIDIKKRDELERKGFRAPWFFVISPTYACNLKCYGCYAHEYEKGQGMSFETFDRILREAKELGIRFLTISGGEPFFWKGEKDGQKIDLIDMAKIHSDMFFQVYTNGILLDKKTIERLAKLGNIAPAISQEGLKKETDERRGKGTWQKISRTRELLSQAGVLHGFSITATSPNTNVITSDSFIDSLIKAGISFGWYFTYIPIGKEPKIELMQTPEQRIHMGKKIWELRSKKPIFIGDFWNDGPWVGGCIAAGRKYLHINAQGDVEPCVFIHFAVDNILDLWKKGKGLKEAITSPFFLDIRKRQLGNDNWLTPCAIIDKPQYLREVVKKYKAYPTHKGAETIIQGEIAHFLDGYSLRLDEFTRPEFKRMEAGDYDGRVVKLSQVIKNNREKNKKEFEITSQ